MLNQKINLNRTLKKNYGSTYDMPKDLSSSDLVNFECALISSTDEGRTFSRFKNIFAENRRAF